MRELNKLSAALVRTVKEAGRYSDGGGLHLQVRTFTTSKGAISVSKVWIFRYARRGGRGNAEMGLGPANDVSLKEAREVSERLRREIREGIDPLQQRKTKRAAAALEAAKSVTFKQAATSYIASHSPGWKNAKHASQWTATLTRYAYPTIGHIAVQDVDVGLVLKVLEPEWTKKPETMSRVRGRIERVLDFATARGFRQPNDNPARWSGALSHLLPAKNKIARTEHHPSLPYAQVPALMARLLEMTSVSARALQITILAATRTGETIGATWSEIDFGAKVWTVPAARAKTAKEHRIPLTPQMISILEKLPREANNPHVFVGGREGTGLSSMALLQLLRGLEGMESVTTHGFRASFKTWCSEETNFPRDIVERCLAHALESKVEQAYRRGDELERRRRVVEAWSRFCCTPPKEGSAKVVSIASAIR